MENEISSPQEISPNKIGTEFVTEQKESIKICKLSKSYNWEIRLVGDINGKQLTRLVELDRIMRERFGSVVKDEE